MSWYKWKVITHLTEKDIWKWITYIDVFKWCETWKLKSFNNETQTAFIVFKCNNNRDLDHWKDYTAEACGYNDLEF